MFFVFTVLKHECDSSGTFRHTFLTETPSLPSGNLCSAGNSCQMKQGTVPGTVGGEIRQTGRRQVARLGWNRQNQR